MHLLLVLMVVIWGANYSLIKVVLRELPPPVFNALRLRPKQALRGGGSRACSSPPASS